MSTSLRSLGLALAALGFLFAGCDASGLLGPETEFAQLDAAATATIAPGGQVDLLAGQHTKVGTVTVDAVSGGFVVTYRITLPGACITEWHLHAATTAAGIPQNPGGPIPGRFRFGGATPAGCTTTVAQTVAFTDITGGYTGGPVVFAAHAVVAIPVGGGDDAIYGIDRATGDIYRIRTGGPIDDAAVSFFFDTTIDPPSNPNWPNGLALAAVDDRLYFTNNTQLNNDPANNPLYFVDLTTNTQHLAGGLQRRSASAVGIDGVYYYVAQATDSDLRRVTFHPDGTVASEAVACPSFTGTAQRMFFGDLAYDAASGLIYGSARVGADMASASTLFSLDPRTCAYHVITQGTSVPLVQLAFDCAGTLHAQDTATGVFYRVDPTTGSFTPNGQTTRRFNDLAIGSCRRETRTETAWGAGTRLRPRGNWATVFTVTP